MRGTVIANTQCAAWAKKIPGFARSRGSVDLAAHATGSARDCDASVLRKSERPGSPLSFAFAANVTAVTSKTGR